jgi:tRNA(Arg) A34 adenosine deaminase TadA
VHLADDEARMQFVLRLADENVTRRSGGPFGAAVVDRSTGRVLAIGVNSVERLRCSVAHAEVIAVALAQARVGSHSLRSSGLPGHELVTSCEPCAMCLGAVGWSGVTRLVCAASRDDAVEIGFDEGLLPASWKRRLPDMGIEVVCGLLRAEARAVMDRYVELGGRIYNP